MNLETVHKLARAEKRIKEIDAYILLLEEMLCHAMICGYKSSENYKEELFNPNHHLSNGITAKFQEYHESLCESITEILGEEYGPKRNSETLPFTQKEIRTDSEENRQSDGGTGTDKEGLER